MIDCIENFHEGIIHHGKQSNRVYGMHVPRENLSSFLREVDSLAKKKEYEKLFMKVPVSQQQVLLERGYVKEASVPFFFQEEEGIFMAKYLSSKRKEVVNKGEIEEVLKVIMQKSEAPSLDVKDLPSNYLLRKLEKEDASKMTHLYQKVFETYPFPIFEKLYIQKTMDEEVVYFGIWNEGELIAVSSSEIDSKNKNAEMTNFAVAPSYRGQNLARFLLLAMEEEMKKTGIASLYTIARAVSYGMNATFAKGGYTFSGTLYNNTQIAGQIESMNVWYKKVIV